VEGTSETVWHLFLLVLTLSSIAAVAIVALAYLAFDEPPEGLARARPWLLGLIGVTLALYVLEWRVLH
jgi:hypothetical protein